MDKVRVYGKRGTAVLAAKFGHMEGEEGSLPRKQCGAGLINAGNAGRLNKAGAGCFSKIFLRKHQKRDDLIRNVGVVKTPQKRGAFVQHYGIEKSF